MKEPNRQRKGEIKAVNNIQLNEEQKEAKRLIIENQIVIITGRAGSGKSLVCAQAALDFLYQKQIDRIDVTRATIEMGGSLGFLPGGLEDKMNPYLEAFRENLIKCTGERSKIDALIADGKIEAFPIQFARGKTIDGILIVEEAQNLTKHQMSGILTRLGKTGKIIINGDIDQKDIREDRDGLKYAIELSKNINGIERINLKENHRSDLVGKILDYEYSRK